MFVKVHQWAFDSIQSFTDTVFGLCLQVEL
jgi:hypothetical protein